MSKKLTYEFVKTAFEKENYKLLSKKYINNSQKLEYICSVDHKYKISWSMWNRGHRCPTCAIIALSGEGHWNWQGGDCM